MKKHRTHSKAYTRTRLLPDFFCVMMLVIAQACSDPISTNEAALETESGL